jgi:hypothetical protein
MSDDIWDDKELIPSNSFIKFSDVGDGVEGVITAISKHRFDDGNLVPQLAITTDDGEEVTLTAGQTRLKVALAEHRPAVGDHLTVRLTQIEKRAGGKTLKHFDVKVKRAADKKAGGEPPF